MSGNQYSHTSSNRLVRRTLALVLAGGKGTRLKQLTERSAKPAVAFGGKYRIIDFTLSNCVNSGIRSVGVLTQYMAHDLIQHIQSGWHILPHQLNEGVTVIPAQQRTGESWYRGTADAIYQNLELIDENEFDRVLILGGDHIYKMDYSRMVNFHAENNAAVSVGCIAKPIEQASSFGVMSLDEEGNIVEFVEKPENPKPSVNNPDEALISMGMYIFNIDVLKKELRAALANPDYGHDFGHNIIPGLLGKRKVCGYVFSDEGHPGENAYWRDVGNLDEYYAANMDLVMPDPDLDIYDPSWPIITHQKQRPGAKFVFNETERRGYATDSILSAGAIISGAAIDKSIISSDVRVEEYSEINDSIILNNASVGKNCRLKKVIVGERCHIPDNMVIGYDLELDKTRFTVSESGVVLVTADMFL